MLENIVKRSNFTDVLIIVIASIAIVGVWRGTWNLFDHFIFPNSFIISQLATILGGLIILLIMAKIR